MRWDEPAPTITTQFNNFGTGRFGHPSQLRGLTLREGAILQSFPPTYKFCPPGATVVHSTVARLVGNAVPPRLGQVVGEALVRAVA
jgi:DNA (cytosine-5)-methyltransferase 1